LERRRKEQRKNLLTNILQDQRDTEVKEDKTNQMKKEHKNFCLNFNNDEKVVSVELLHKEGIFEIAKAFSIWLTANGIAHQVSTQKINEVKTEEDGSTNS